MRNACWTLIAALVPLAACADQFQQAVVTPSSDGPWRASFLSTVCIPETHAYEYTVQKPVTVQKQVEVNGELQTRELTEYVAETRTATKTVLKTVCKPWHFEFDPANVAACDVSRRKLSTAELKQRIKGPTVLLWTCSGGLESVPDYYAAVYKPGTIVILESGGASRGTAPVPALPVPAGQAPQPPQESSVRPLSGVQALPVAFRAPGEATATVLSMPGTPAPQIVFVSREGADALKIRLFNEHQVTMPVTIKPDHPQGVEKSLMVQQTVRHSETRAVPLAALRISTTEGADLHADKVKERFGAGETAALLSADGLRVDPFWLQIVQPRVLVLRGVQFPPTNVHYGAPQPMPGPQPVPQAVPVPQPAPVPPGAPAAQPEPPKA